MRKRPLLGDFDAIKPLVKSRFSDLPEKVTFACSVKTGFRHQKQVSAQPKNVKNRIPKAAVFLSTISVRKRVFHPFLDFSAPSVFHPFSHFFCTLKTDINLCNKKGVQKCHFFVTFACTQNDHFLCEISDL